MSSASRIAAIELGFIAHYTAAQPTKVWRWRTVMVVRCIISLWGNAKLQQATTEESLFRVRSLADLHVLRLVTSHYLSLATQCSILDSLTLRLES
jgi:hypothetical protein